MINYKLNKLNNGLQVITAPMKETKAVTILIMMKIGSRYEKSEESGISHFLEHLFFKGTINRPTTLDISRELDAIGAYFNAFTSEEYTGFYVSCAADHFDKGLDILSDMLLNSKFDQKEIDKELGVIIEEINMYKDLPHKYVVDLAKTVFFGNTPLGRPVIGNVETVSSLKRKNFVDYLQKNYNCQNALITVAGSGQDELWLEKIQNKFSKLPSGEKSIYEKNTYSYDKPQILVHHKKTDQAHLVLGFKSLTRFDKKKYSQNVLNNLFGGMMSSKLFIEVREKRGLAYSVHSSTWELDDTGIFYASAGLDIKRIDDAIKVILDEFYKLKKEKITDGELIHSKENIKGKLYLSLEDSFSIAEFLTEQYLLENNIEQPEELLKKTFETTTTNIHELAKEFFTPENLGLTIIGPFKEKEKFEKLLKS